MCEVPPWTPRACTTGSHETACTRLSRQTTRGSVRYCSSWRCSGRPPHNRAATKHRRNRRRKRRFPAPAASSQSPPSLLTPSRHRPARNPAVQQSPATLRCAILSTEAREAVAALGAKRNDATAWPFVDPLHALRARGIRAKLSRCAQRMKSTCCSF
jgi:hypothetical protein